MPALADLPLSFQLQGIPLDNTPLLQLCRSVGVHEGLASAKAPDLVEVTTMDDRRIKVPGSVANAARRGLIPQENTR